MKQKDIHYYDDIISMPRHKSKVHKPMLILDRAAQFAPFSALTGHKEAVEEAGRLTSQRIVLDEHQKDVLDMKMSELFHLLEFQPQITLTYFQVDGKKRGGEYRCISGRLKKIDRQNRVLWLEKPIKIDDIVDIQIDC